MSRFSPGQTIVLQEVWHDKVWAARPMRVVRDDDELVALWFPRRTRWMAPIDDPAREWNDDRGERLAECALCDRWVHRELEWDVDTLSLMRPHDWHALWVSWLPGGEHWGWYINLQRPFRRTRLGFETMDLALADHRRRRELALEGRGRARHVRRAGRIRAGAARPPQGGRPRRCRARRSRRRAFGEPWPEWRPDQEWPLPELPVGWNRLAR